MASVHCFSSLTVNGVGKLCCPECLGELFFIFEDGSIRCAQCGVEVEAKKDAESVAIH